MLNMVVQQLCKIGKLHNTSSLSKTKTQSLAEVILILEEMILRMSLWSLNLIQPLEEVKITQGRPQSNKSICQNPKLILVVLLNHQRVLSLITSHLPL